MQFIWIDFFVGVLLMNAMPHATLGCMTYRAAQ